MQEKVDGTTGGGEGGVEDGTVGLVAETKNHTEGGGGGEKGDGGTAEGDTATATAVVQSPQGTIIAVAEVGRGPEERETWDKKVEFLLAVIGFAVDLGNVWRFPYICYQNGGGAFLIPYTLMLVFGGLPLFYMELALGQFHRCGCLTIWRRICPALKGVGYAICIIDTYMGMCYNTIIGWAVYYLFASFRYELPWTSCNNSWNTPSCSPIILDPLIADGVDSVAAAAVSAGSAFAMDGNMAYLKDIVTGGGVGGVEVLGGDEGSGSGGGVEVGVDPGVIFSEGVKAIAKNITTSPAKEFFERSVLESHRSDGLDRMGPIKGSLALCVFAVFVLVYFSLWKGVRSTGKAVWFTALAPYVVLFILLARGVTLPGAEEGIRYYLTPQWNKLQTSKVWIDAASQIFFSLGPGFGTLLALSSYNKFNNNCYRDAILTSSINCLTSFLAGFVIFSVLGYMAHVQNKSVADVGLEGPGLVFIVYPEAIATMTGSVFWSIIFFLMLITLGLDSTFGGLEAMITGLCDEYPKLLGRHREIFVGCLLLLVYICGLPTTTYGGEYLVNLLNTYGPGIAILFVVFVEATGVCWIYGVERFSNDIQLMLGHRPGLFWRVCWKYISPIFILVIFIFSLVNYEELIGGEYPAWSISVGWVLTASSIIWIPVYIVYKIIITPGKFLERLSKVIKPEEFPEEVAFRNASAYGTHV